MTIQAIQDAKKLVTFISDRLDELTPHEVSDITVRLAICFGNLGQELAVSEAIFAKKWLELKKECSTNAETDKRVRATEEYFQKKELEYTVRGIKELIQALKKRQQVLSDEANIRY